MPASRSLTVAILAAALLCPVLTHAQEPVRLRLDPADTDGDGKVSDAERFTRLATAPAAPGPVAAFERDRPLVRFGTPHVDPPGALEMARRVEPPSEFETALEDRFNRELERQGKIDKRPPGRNLPDPNAPN